MKNKRVFALILGAALLWVWGIYSAVYAQNDQYDLALINLATQPDPVRVGQETAVTFSYTNAGEGATPESFEVWAQLIATYTETEPPVIFEPCVEQVPDVANLQPGANRSYTFQNCDLIFRNEGQHKFRVELLANELETNEGVGAYQALPGDANPDNNGITRNVIVGPYESNLPDSLGRLLAGLGMFFAVMAIVAVGTEVIIDSFKVAVGLKSKVTSLDALERYEKFIPGQLATLGVSAESQKQFEVMSRNMRTTLDSTLKPVNDFIEVKTLLKAGEFSQAISILESYQSPSNQAEAARKLAQAKANVKQVVAAGLGTLQQKLSLPEEFVGEIQTTADLKIEEFDGQNPDDVIKNLVNVFQTTEDWTLKIADGWLEEQRETFLSQGQTEVLGQFDSQVRPLLSGIGFSGDSIDSVKKQIALGLKTIDTQSESMTETYVSSLRGLLDSVEYRRYQTQSPSRKLWRLMRSWRYGWIFFSLVLALVLFFLLWLFTPIMATAGFYYPHYIGIFILVFLATSIFLLLFAWLGKWIFEKRTETSLQTINDALAKVKGEEGVYQGKKITKAQLEELKANREENNKKFLGENGIRSFLFNENGTILLKVETFFNYLRAGFDPDTYIDPYKFDQPELVKDYAEKVKGFEVTAETLAPYIQARTDQQQDEEKSRLRILRVISFVLGLALAYTLQIDAAVLLDAAVPGISNVINNVFYISGPQLHMIRPWLPADRALTAGIILTGLAAAAGSTFWHDRLGQLQAAKKGAEAVADATKSAQTMIQSGSQSDKS